MPCPNGPLPALAQAVDWDLHAWYERDQPAEHPTARSLWPNSIRPTGGLRDAYGRRPEGGMKGGYGGENTAQQEAKPPGTQTAQSMPVTRTANITQHDQTETKTNAQVRSSPFDESRAQIHPLSAQFTVPPLLAIGQLPLPTLPSTLTPTKFATTEDSTPVKSTPAKRFLPCGSCSIHISAPDMAYCDNSACEQGLWHHRECLSSDEYDTWLCGECILRPKDEINSHERRTRRLKQQMEMEVPLGRLLLEDRERVLGMSWGVGAHPFEG
ncbi:hypothetical protein CC86DRAFT_382913 [Ophiobolus disseminans]|uniref:Uncharacterized protein n=1 Tax=Ophiobolus disseminans TaxID=1469910 RepID=A0A6A6ZZT7_9PLEO|nr:hypothetical protein CC86DRAFT_382913 [Ophiobolus disseminans]